MDHSYAPPNPPSNQAFPTSIDHDETSTRRPMYELPHALPHQPLALQRQQYHPYWENYRPHSQTNNYRQPGELQSAAHPPHLVSAYGQWQPPLPGPSTSSYNNHAHSTPVISSSLHFTSRIAPPPPTEQDLVPSTARQELPQDANPTDRTKPGDRASSVEVAQVKRRTERNPRKPRRKANEQPRDHANRRYFCELCPPSQPKAFARPSALQLHMLTHTRKQDYECSTCNRRFSIASNLRRHQKLHTDQQTG
ncbi:hypothetical protein T439DRAFT_322579 [Meredithblackwellia eburnea MCA 4105]